MKIYGDVLSPFVRMCLVTAYEVGLKDRITVVKTPVKPTEPNEMLAAMSPLGKVPVLETDHHHPIYDSRVIMEYLAHVAGSSTFIPNDGVKRFRVLTLLGLSQGLADSAVALRYELAQRPAGLQWNEWIARTKQRIFASAEEIEKNWLETMQDIHAGSIAAACAFAYVDLRHPDLNWRENHTGLTKAIARLTERESFKAWPI